MQRNNARLLSSGGFGHIYNLNLNNSMKVDLGQNVRLVVSLWRFVVSRLRFVMSFRRFVMAFRRFGSPISEVDSANCQFNSSALVVSSFRSFVMSFHRFVMSFRRLVMAFRHFDSSTQRGYNSTYIHELYTWFHALIHDVFIHNLLCADWKGSLKSYLRHSIEFVLNRVNERFHESENETGCLVTLFDRVLYIPRAILAWTQLFSRIVAVIVPLKNVCEPSLCLNTVRSGTK